MSTKKIQILGGFPQADFNQTDETKSDYIKNKPAPIQLDGDPTTSTQGALGQFYINTTTNALFICTNITDQGLYTWQKVLAQISGLESASGMDCLDAGSITDEGGDLNG